MTEMENSDVIKMEIDESEYDEKGDKTPDDTFYRVAVCSIIVEGSHIAREVCELRFALFLQASHHYLSNGKAHELHPFPFCFYHEATKSYRYDELWLCLSRLPSFGEINERASLPELSWELLHWIFTNPLKIELMKGYAFADYYTEILRTETKLMTIPRRSNSCCRYEIYHSNEMNSTKIFMIHKNEFGSFFAYHGSPHYNFHSIVHRGLHCSLNVRRVYGPGTYLSSDLDTAKAYSKLYAYPSSAVLVYCIAIVEVIKHPSIKVINCKDKTIIDTMKFGDTSSSHRRYYVVNSDDLMQLKYLIVFY